VSATTQGPGRIECSAVRFNLRGVGGEGKRKRRVHERLNRHGSRGCQRAAADALERKGDRFCQTSARKQRGNEQSAKFTQALE